MSLLSRISLACVKGRRRAAFHQLQERALSTAAVAILEVTFLLLHFFGYIPVQRRTTGGTERPKLPLNMGPMAISMRLGFLLSLFCNLPSPQTRYFPLSLSFRQLVLIQDAYIYLTWYVSPTLGVLSC